MTSGVHPKTAENVLLGSSSKAPGETNATLLICSIFEDRRPLKGVVGLLDWRLRGLLSRFIIAGSISGKKNETTYIPVRHKENQGHLLLIGLGASSKAADCSSDELSQNLKRAISGLKFQRVTLSRSCFPSLNELRLQKILQNIEVEFVE